ncbi:MAG: DUF1398 family protein [Terracidiphilus sp.]
MKSTFSHQTAERTPGSAAALSEAEPAKFTGQDIRAAYVKTRTGADFPRLIQDLKKLGIVSYDHLLESGSNVFHGQDGQSVSLSNMRPSVPVNDHADVQLLKRHMSEHQRGLTNYPTLCGLAGQAGVDKWTSNLLAMTCTYFDRSGRNLHVESIPTGEYEKK